MLRILESENGKKEHQPVSKRRDLGFAFDSRSENHPVILRLRHKMPPLHRGEFFATDLTKLNIVAGSTYSTVDYNAS
jgi:hypothetical protein